MPNTLEVSKTLKLLEYVCYFLLLIIIPLKNDNHYLEYDEYMKVFNKTFNNIESYQERLEAFKVNYYYKLE